MDKAGRSQLWEAGDVLQFCCHLKAVLILSSWEAPQISAALV